MNVAAWGHWLSDGRDRRWLAPSSCTAKRCGASSPLDHRFQAEPSTLAIFLPERSDADHSAGSDTHHTPMQNEWRRLVWGKVMGDISKG